MALDGADLIVAVEIEDECSECSKTEEESPRKRPTSWLLRQPLTQPSNYEEKLMAIGQAT